MTGLFVCQELFVDEGPVRVDFVEFSDGGSIYGMKKFDGGQCYLRTILSLPLSSVGLPLDFAMRISAPRAVSDWSTRPTL
jgi:hypothetical protein